MQFTIIITEDSDYWLVQPPSRAGVIQVARTRGRGEHVQSVSSASDTEIIIFISLNLPRTTRKFH